MFVYLIIVAIKIHLTAVKFLIFIVVTVKNYLTGFKICIFLGVNTDFEILKTVYLSYLIIEAVEIHLTDVKILILTIVTVKDALTAVETYIN